MADVQTGQHVTIVGAGLAGALLATRLGQAGFNVNVYESRSDPRGKDLVAGRSINLAISARGFHALGQIGLTETILELSTPMRGRMMHSVDGQLQFQPYSAHSEDVIHSVSRAELNMALIAAADRVPNVEFHFDHKCVDTDLDRGSASFFDRLSQKTVHSQDGLVIGCDGAYSAVRKRMQRLDRFDYSQSYLKHGYKELCIPAKPDGTHALEPNALHIWPRQSFMMIALPNLDGSFTCTLFLAFESENGPAFSKLGDEAQVNAFFDAQFPDAKKIMPTLIDDFFENPTSALVTVRCGPWFYEDKVTLVGDACHAVVPFYGQGANAAFGDCTALGDLMIEQSANGRSTSAATLREYFDRRKIHTDTLADLAVLNFVEMRDHTGSQLFLMKKKLEQTLHRLFPKSFLPLYSMVSFSCVPYHDAVQRAKRQWRFVRRVALVTIVAVIALVVWIVIFRS
ncbi:MAG: kynurenine 3-monooxygenase [Phycisphaerae bacterium]|nr:MAG: kynurenine 3-monooxygenase [Phycisphaerae bacterium]